jgi:pyruvate,water dikinase
MGFKNAQLMIPFVRTIDELQNLLKLLAKFGLKRKEKQLKIYMMCELPSNIVLAKEFLAYVDGFSIGSNDLTSLVLGLDRNSTLVADLFNERNEAVKKMLHEVIKECKKQKKYLGICGQAPSDHLDFAEWLMKEGIQVLSLSPDAIVKTWLGLAKKLKRKK